jgi:hypothetical protein
VAVVALRSGQLGWWMMMLALGCTGATEGDDGTEPLPEEALLDPRYDDELHAGACPTVQTDATRETIVELLGGSAYMGEERFSRLSMQEGLLNMVIGVRGGADFSRVGDIECPQDDSRSCAERDQALEEAGAISVASQRCVRALVEEVGGQVTETFPLGNALSASLSWQQLLRVAAHPHVQSLSDNDETTPPP